MTTNLSPDILYGYGDPAVLRLEAAQAGDPHDWYYVFCTSNDAPDAFPILRSRDLQNWEPRGFIFPRGAEPPWASVGENVADFWAPEVHLVDGEFRAYFVARDRSARSELCIGVARARHPEGPYSAEPEPLLTGDKIDPHVYVQSAGRSYLYWKEDKNGIWPNLLNEFIYTHPSRITRLFENRQDRVTASFLSALWPWIRELQPMERFFVQHALIQSINSDFAAFEQRLSGCAHQDADPEVQHQCRTILRNLKTTIYVQPLSSDGVSLTGDKEKVLENDQGWEAHVVEGMWVTSIGDRYYMFYAGNDFSTVEYGIGAAVSDSPLGPFEKPTGAFLQSTAEWLAPGHPSVFVDRNGKATMFLHAYLPGSVGYKQFRALLCIGLNFDTGAKVKATRLAAPIDLQFDRKV
ncbi:MAG TPA: family 43 glycosylhydrolase [Bryobacteraceae bacterium]|nr:family 43 glycosylhydrolase [Bryobacteraceae bacterium]